MNKLELQKMANEVRKGIVTGVHAAKAGHPGGSLSAADLFTYLYFTHTINGNNVITPTIPAKISINLLINLSNIPIVSFDVAINNCPSKSCTSDEKVIVPLTLGRYFTEATFP